ncbi:FAD-dependent oxidoreductase [Pseudomonas sp. MD195_PC81_125]|nr:FAD-dependent oxidoreductase [Pseudomonas sp. MD195_PC81_125]
MTQPVHCEIAVIGAGVVGVASALWLRRQGYRVLLLEREAIAAGGVLWQRRHPGPLWRDADCPAFVAESDSVAAVFEGFALRHQLGAPAATDALVAALSQ